MLSSREIIKILERDGWKFVKAPSIQTSNQERKLKSRFLKALKSNQG